MSTDVNTNAPDEDQLLYGENEGQPANESVNPSDAMQDNEARNPEEEEEEEEDEDEDDVQIVLNTDSVDKGSFPKRPTFFRGNKMQNFNPNQPALPKPMQNQVNTLQQTQGGPSPIVAQNQKNVFDIDIDSLEEKPWRKPGVDISDYFNYGFNEDTWRQYCAKQVQLRLEQSMQGRIKVYESKTNDQQKIDLPPELLALTEGAGSGRPPSQPPKRPPSQSPQQFPPRGQYQKIPTVPMMEGGPGMDMRRRGRDQDDSVVQVLTSSEDGMNFPPEQIPPEFRRDDRDERRDYRDERRREDYGRGYGRDDRRDPRERRPDYPPDSRGRDHRDDYDHKRRDKDYKSREEEDRSKRRR